MGASGDGGDPATRLRSPCRPRSDSLTVTIAVAITVVPPEKLGVLIPDALATGLPSVSETPDFGVKGSDALVFVHHD